MFSWLNEEESGLHREGNQVQIMLRQREEELRREEIEGREVVNC